MSTTDIFSTKMQMLSAALTNIYLTKMPSEHIIYPLYISP